MKKLNGTEFWEAVAVYEKHLGLDLLEAVRRVFRFESDIALKNQYP